MNGLHLLRAVDNTGYKNQTHSGPPQAHILLPTHSQTQKGAILPVFRTFFCIATLLTLYAALKRKEYILLQHSTYTDPEKQVNSV